MLKSIPEKLNNLQKSKEISIQKYTQTDKRQTKRKSEAAKEKRFIHKVCSIYLTANFSEIMEDKK